MKQLLGALKNNDTPTPNAGLSTVLRFSSPSNPVKRSEPEMFFGMMRNSQYSLLLGGFDTFTITGSEDLGMKYGVQTVAIGVTLYAATQAMIDGGVDFSFMENTGDKSAVSLKWQLSKDAESECWLSDTLFFVPVKSKGSTMEELTDADAAKESAKFTGTPASAKLKAQARRPSAVEPSQLALAVGKAGLLKPSSPLLQTVGSCGVIARVEYCWPLQAFLS